MGSARDLIDAFKPTEETFTVLLGTMPVIVKEVKDIAVLAKMNRRARKLVKMASSGKIPAPFKPFLPIDDNLAENVCILTELVLDPKFTDVEALEFLREAGIAASTLCGQIRTHWGEALIVVEEEALDDMGEGSK